MASSTEIANLALSKLGQPAALALTDDTKAARVMNRLFIPTRDAELRRNWWKFATKRDQILALVDAPSWGFARQFPMPADFLALIQVGEFYSRPQDQRGLWALESNDSGQVLLTDFEAPLKIRYIKKVDNTALFDALFVEMFACKLAHDGCEEITSSNTKKAAIRDDYLMAREEALRCDALERVPDELAWGSWLESRQWSGSPSPGGAWQAYGSGTTIL